MASIINGAAALPAKFVKLSGPDNYKSWVKEFKVIAYVQGVWSIYDGTEAILPKPVKPDRPDRLDASGPGVATRSSASTEYAISFKNYKMQLEDFKADTVVYLDNDRRARLALGLLIGAIEPYIYNDVNTSSKNDARKLWDHLEDKNQPQEDKLRQRLIQTLVDITLKDPHAAREYIIKSKELYDDITKAKGGWTYAQLVTNIVRGLPKEYNFLVTH